MNAVSAKSPRNIFDRVPPALIRAGAVLAILILGVGLGGLLASPARQTAVAAIALLLYVVVIVWDPLNGLLLWIITQPVADLYFNLSLGSGIPDISPTRVCIALLVALVLARAAAGRTKLVRFTNIEWVGLIFLIGMTQAVPRSATGWYSLQGIFDRYFVPPLVYFLAKNLVRDRVEVRKAIVAVTLLSAYVGAYAIYEQLTGHILLPAGEVTSVDYGNGLRILRGLLGHPHEFGRVLDIAIPLNFFLLLEEQRPGRRLFFLLTLALGLAGLFVTFRRTAWIAGLASMFIVQWFYPRFRTMFVVLLLVVGGITYLYWDQVGESSVSARVETGNTATLNGRTEGWAYAVELWEREPLLGQGHGQFARIARREGQRDTAIESEYYEILVSAGLAGFVPYVLLLGLLGFSLVTPFRKAHDPATRWLIVVYWGALVSYVINAYTATVTQLITTTLIFLLAGALFQFQSPRPESQPQALWPLP